MTFLRQITVEFDSTAKNCKSLIEDQVRNATEETRTVSHEDDPELSRAMATSEANIVDEFNGPSDEKTILYSDDERIGANNSNKTSDDESDIELREVLDSEEEEDEDPGDELSCTSTTAESRAKIWYQ